MFEVRYAEIEDKDFWYGLDKHLQELEFEKKVQDKQAYILLEDGVVSGKLFSIDLGN